MRVREALGINGLSNLAHVGRPTCRDPLRTDFHDDTRHNFGQSHEYLRHQWKNVGEAIAVSEQYHKGNLVDGKILLISKTLIGCQQHLESYFRHEHE